MAREADYYTAHEAARVLGVSPARVRQMLRAGELEGERGPERVEGVPGPWRVPASAVRNHREGGGSVDVAETVALPFEEIAPAGPPADSPSETSERLSEGVGELRDKAVEILEELERLEVRLEATEVEQLALRETAAREKERAEKLEAELEARKAGGYGEQRGPYWRRLLGR